MNETGSKTCAVAWSELHDLRVVTEDDIMILK